MKQGPDALVMVYNADEGVAAMLFDTAHKFLRPDTYPCDLCAITYGAFSMRAAWKDWLAQQDFTAEFFHRQDFQRAHPTLAALPLPAILRRDGTSLAPLLGPQDMDAGMSVEALVARIDAALTAS